MPQPHPERITGRICTLPEPGSAGNRRAQGLPGALPPAGYVLAGVSAAAMSLASVLLPGSPPATSASGPCTQTVASPSPAAAPAPAATPAAPLGTAICLAVSRTTRSSRLLPGHDADYTITVRLASTVAADAGPAVTPTPDSSATAILPGSAADVAIGFTAGQGGHKPVFTACPAAVTQDTCPLGTLLPGAPPAVLKAELAIPRTATAGLRLRFTVTTATSTTGVLTAGRTRTIVVASPASPSPRPSPGTSSPHPSPASSAPRPAPTPATTRAAATTAAATPGTGSALAAGLGAPTPATSPSLGTLPPPSPASSGPTFPIVTPGPALTSTPVTLTGPMGLRAADTSGQFPLRGQQAGLQAGALGLLATGMFFAIAKVSLRRRVPGRGSGGWRRIRGRSRTKVPPPGPEPPAAGDMPGGETHPPVAASDGDAPVPAAAPGNGGA